MKDLERGIDNEEYQDMYEVKNTLNCLESIFEDMKNDKEFEKWNERREKLKRIFTIKF